MVDLEILKTFGSTNERLKEIFTAQPPGPREKFTPKERKAREKLVALREKWQERIANRQNEHIEFSLANHELYSAVDLAWDAPPVSKALYPLMLYAQGRLNTKKCLSQLDALSCKDDFVTKDDAGNESVDLPKFVETHVNLVRSVLTRRKAAQTNKYNNLWPYLKYESRSTSEVGKLRADVFSQRVDMMADDYDYRSHDEEVIDHTLRYAHVVDFIRSAWERETQLVRDRLAPGLETKGVRSKAQVVKEGLVFVNPHPTRTFWDNAYALKSLNSDTGCTYCGYWDVVRAGSVLNNTSYWNRKNLGWTNNQVNMFSTYANYFSQYYCTIVPPRATVAPSLTQENERVNNVGVYSGEFEDTSMVIGQYFEKIVPKEEGFGDYPYPVWVRFMTAGWNTVIWAEFLPSTPCCVASYNEDSSRQINVSLAMELMGYQDQMTNLLSYLLLCIKSDNHKVLVVDIDTMTSEQLKKFRAQAKGNSFYNEVTVLEVSRSKLQEMGLDPDKVIRLVETKSSTAIDVIFRAMAQLMQMTERMVAMSPQEQGQPAPREITATENNMIANTTESVYNHISDAIDTYRAAKKRLIYESYVNFGQQEFRVPVINRYTTAVIRAAGLEAYDENQGAVPAAGDGFRTVTITGTREKLVHDYIFTSRDGAERASNLQSAQYLAEVLKSILPIPAVQMALRKAKFYEMINEIFRLTGAFDIKLEAEPGEENEPLAGQTDADVLQEIVQIVGQNTKDIQALGQQMQALMGQLRGEGPAPG